MKKLIGTIYGMKVYEDPELPYDPYSFGTIMSIPFEKKLIDNTLFKTLSVPKELLDPNHKRMLDEMIFNKPIIIEKLDANTDTSSIRKD